ncbi:glycosyltransferase family protein [Parapedobacter koreensis]|uniref:Dolichyl-phosphate-mannose-protein mannosyltransferase n=1 Tax=Parapedobacter koreensis TaxID=332977 RepID=A0A1H7IJY8_9SPHI|nr:hypothetical protein [Parapedobacter koreensis]SEK61870.1 hypothetical protein SAMN05421740_102240 [Parapedobacter koreensis]
MDKASGLAKHYFLIGFFLMLVLGLTLVILSLTFFLDGHVGRWQFPLALVVATGINAYILFRSQWMGTAEIKGKYYTLGASVLFVLLAILISGQFYDISEDGQEYHQEAIIQLRQGWNPYRTALDDSITTHSIWINHYAKGMETIQAAIYATTGRIETGKATNLLLIVAGLFFSLSILVPKISTPKAWITSILLTCNPVVIVQALTYYVDGVLGSIFLIFIAATILALKEKQWMHYLLIVVIITLAFGIKFTAVVYMAMLMAAVFCWLLFHKKLKSHKILIVGFVSGVVLGILAGFNPYVTNTLNFGHPFYPLMGSKKVDIMTRNSPATFGERSPAERFFISLFSHTDNAIMETGGKPVLKVPFTLNEVDIVNSGKVDTRVAGFGPFFSGIVILAILLFILLAIQCRKERRFKNILSIIITLVVTIVIIPESWWARYVPQFWFIPIILLVTSEWLLPGKHKVLKFAVYTTLAANVIFAFSAIVQNIVITSQINHQLAILKDTSQPIVIDFRKSASNRIRFQEHEIPYIQQSFENDSVGEWIIRSEARFLPPENINRELTPPVILRLLGGLRIKLKPWGGIGQ